MDSRLLYSTTNALSHKLTWNDWIHFGIQHENSYSIVQDNISSHFGEEQMYLVYERNNSGELKVKIELFNSILGTSNFFLWNTELTKAIEFNKIGILRVGELNSNHEQ